MKKTGLIILTALLIAGLALDIANACTNFLITRGASKDGSTMITYSADSHVLYGELYYWPERDWEPGTMLDVYEWDTGKFLGTIPQVAHTYNVVGNMNNHQLAIGETTYGGRGELRNPDGIIDYGSLIYITLQRAKSAREAIKTMSELVDNYGYYSSGESFSIADKDEVWIMELIGKGPGRKGAVWVARMIPDGYISGHANQARITGFPLADGKKSISSKDLDRIFDPAVETVYAYDVIDLAREKGWYDGKDKDFSFSDTYAPVDFGGARFCEARVWAMFNRVNDKMGKYLDYAMGYDLDERMPLWIKPDTKLGVHDVMELMRDYYQDTPMDMSKDPGAGPYASTIRWRPMTWEVDGETYIHERATSTQQTGFSFVTQSRNWLPDPVGGILWFGVDDTYYTVYSPMYCGMQEIPHSFEPGNGDIMTFSDNAAFWVFNQVSNFAYSRRLPMEEDIKNKQVELEKGYVEETAMVDRIAAELYKLDPALALKYVTDYSVDAGNKTVAEWKDFYAFLFTKYMDGNIKEEREVPEGYKYVTPKVSQPGYSKEWYEMIIRSAGDKLKMR
ncbi:MAG: C69 family dipeptidase [Bacteroidales bacterium]|nr:C69 family dipeptidase [Bacteroidales bacterium]